MAASHAPTIAALLTAVLAGCALIVGDPVGHADLDAGLAPHADSAPPRLDASAPDSTTPRDSGHDARQVTMHDAPSADVSTVDAAKIDATVSDAGTDAHMSDAAHKDGSYCANYTAPDGYSDYCEDFDETPDALPFGTAETFDGGAVSVVAKSGTPSPPNCLETTVTPHPHDGGTYSQAAQEVILGSGTSYALAYDVLLSAGVSGSNGDYLAGLYFHENTSSVETSSIALFIEEPTPGGEIPVKLVESSPGASISHPTVDVAWSGWMHIELTVENTGSGIIDSLTINGQVIEANVKLASSFAFTNPASAWVGWSFTESTSDVTAYFDNVVMLWR
jgi:hypothetical protein